MTLVTSFCPVLMHQNNEMCWVSKKGGRGKKQNQESCRAAFMVAVISCQQQRVLSVSLCALDSQLMSRGNPDRSVFIVNHHNNGKKSIKAAN